MRKFWFGSSSPAVSTLAAFFALLLTTANAPAQSRSDSSSDDSGSSVSSSSRDSDRSSRDNQSDNNQSSSSRSSSRSSQANGQQEHASLGVMLYNDRSNPLEVRRVMPDSPAEEAGLERGDEILSINGQRVSSVDQLRRQIERVGAKEEVEIGILRDGQRETVTATLGSRRSADSSNRGRNQQQYSQGGFNRGRNQPQYSQDSSNRGGGQQTYNVRQTGGNYEEFDQWSRNPAYEQGFWDGYAHAQQQYGHPSFANQGNQSGNSYSRGSRSTSSSQNDQSQDNPRYSEGYRGSRDRAFLGVTLDENARDHVRVSGVYPNSPAEQAGIRRGDVIVAIDDQDVQSSRDLQHLLSQYDPDDDLSISVDRNGRERTLHATLESQQQVFAEFNNRGSSERMGQRNTYGQGSGSQSNYRDGYSDNRRQRQQSQEDESDSDNY